MSFVPAVSSALGLPASDTSLSDPRLATILSVCGWSVRPPHRGAEREAGGGAWGGGRRPPLPTQRLVCVCAGQQCPRLQ